MTPVGWIAFWAVLFVISHLVISAAAVRPRLMAALGEKAYRGIYSLVAFATLGPLIYEFAVNKHAGPMLWFIRQHDPVRWLVWLLMLLAFVLFVASLINPNPASLGAPPGSGHAHGILKITRHPGFVAFSLFGLAHILMNGWLGDVIFFGMFPVLGIIGGVHQDQRKLGEIGETYHQLMAETSFIPFGAILSGRQKFTFGDVPWIGIAGGVAVTMMIVALHPIIFGGHPLG
jgi:uncharacterized membrane protein